MHVYSHGVEIGDEEIERPSTVESDDIALVLAFAAVIDSILRILIEFGALSACPAEVESASIRAVVCLLLKGVRSA